MFIKKIALLCLLSNFLIQAKGPFPIQFSIPESKMVDKIPEKERDFAFLIPAQEQTYIYSDEPAYQRAYQQSLYAITTKKGGWDCMRHYEILANGCIPYFINLDECNPKTMELLPRELILEAMNLPGMPIIKVQDPRRINPNDLKIDHDKFDIKRYYEILQELLDYTRQYLTTKSMAEYMLNQLEYHGGKILFLSGQTDPDYMRECSLIGLRQFLGDKLIDFPKIDFLYKTYSKDVKKLYGKGFSYTKIIDDIKVDRNDIEKRIHNKEFELIIYGSVHRGLPFHDHVKKKYDSKHIVYICGEDAHRCVYSNWNNLFLREFDAIS